MHTELVSPDNSVADFEDVQSEGSRTLRNVSQDSCDGDIQLARPRTSASVPSYSEHQQQLLSLQEAEERMLKSNEDRHRQLLCVHEKMVTQMKGVQKLIHSTVEELRKHNTYMEAIVHCLLKQNDLHSSTVVTSFLPSTYVGTLEAHDVFQQNNEPVIETEAEMPPQQAATCISSDKIVTAGQNKSVPLAVLSAVTLVETISNETPLTSQMAESATPSSSVSCVHEQLCSSTPLCTQSEGDKTKSSECIGSLPAKLGKKKFMKKKKNNLLCTTDMYTLTEKGLIFVTYYCCRQSTKKHQNGLLCSFMHDQSYFDTALSKSPTHSVTCSNITPEIVITVLKTVTDFFFSNVTNLLKVYSLTQQSQ
ncbi:hypothetical protein FKM82_023297 [Ascaphus truei]